VHFKLVVIEHNCQHLDARTVREKKAWQSIVLSLDELVLIGDTTHASYVRNNIALSCFSIDHAYLPAKKIIADLTELYPPSFFSFAHTHHPLIMMNAAQVKMVASGDLYGFDTALEALASLRHNYPAIGLIIFLARIGDETYFAQIKEIIHGTALSDHVFFVHGKPLAEALSFADCFIRPSRIDSFGISIAEAIHAGIPAIASDVCRRAPGTILCNAGDVQDLVAKMTMVLQK
ncbi:MAG TPA: glycosyltransferase, partial [Chitinophagaceae bacterium]|nr:glycosyltransferase [Chitinophagaceae bacterium]